MALDVNSVHIVEKETPMTDKKTAIIEATISAVAKYGLSKTNAQLVAEEMNIAQSSIFYYFPQQQQLFNSLNEYITKHNSEQVKQLVEDVQASNSFERLCRFIKGNLLWAVNNRDHVTVLLYSLAESRQSPTISKEVSSILKSAEDKVYFYLVTGIAEGEFTVKSNIRSLARFINQSVNGTVITHFHLQEDWDIDSYMDDLTSYLKELIHLR